MRRNLVVLLDGTSNEVKDNLTNVAKLYRVLVRSEMQRVFYHPGIGTVPLVSDWAPRTQRAVAAFGLATGWGIDDNVLAAYEYLARTYRAGDRIFLFGFSRGAYTARVLAGLIHLLGLVEPEQLNLARFILKAYKQAESDNDLAVAWRFRRVIGGRPVPIDFLGLWDSVASMIVRGRGLVYLPYTKHNPSVRTMRQAAAIDERRRMFRLYEWGEDQMFQPDPFAAAIGRQDQQTVWFAGDHSDIGGGYAEAESQAAKFPLLWMAHEAQAYGLELKADMLEHVGSGAPLPNGTHHYVAPDALAPIHKSLTGGWRLLEFMPKAARYRRFPSGAKRSGIYFPNGEPRSISEGALLHSSVVERLGGDYRPPNLPAQYTIAQTQVCAR